MAERKEISESGRQRSGPPAGDAPRREDEDLVEDNDAGRADVADIGSLLDHLVEGLSFRDALLALGPLVVTLVVVRAGARHARHVEAHLDELVERPGLASGGSLGALALGRRRNLERDLGL